MGRTHLIMFMTEPAGVEIKICEKALGALKKEEREKNRGMDRRVNS